jgi:hypothetical protein
MASRLCCGFLLVLGAHVWGCGDALGPAGEFALTIDECEEIGGTPLFDPEDQRPLQLSCPQGLLYMGQFEEDFYGTEGGVCCGGSPSSKPASSEDESDEAATEDSPAEDTSPEDTGTEL